MRNLLASVALATLTVAPLTTRTAEACGGSYESFRPAPPQVTVVMSFRAQHSNDVSRPFGMRSFAVVGHEPNLTPDAEWRRILTTSFDHTEVAPAIGTYVADTFTLVGTTSTRVVKTQRRVGIKNDLLKKNRRFDAFELPVKQGDDFKIALRGDHAEAAWHSLAGSYTDTSALRGTNLSVTREQPKDGVSRFTVLDGKRIIGTYDGMVLGAVDVDGARYLVVTAGNGLATTLAVPMS